MDEIKEIFEKRKELYRRGRFATQLSWKDFREDIINTKQKSLWNYKQKIIHSIIKARRVIL